MFRLAGFQTKSFFQVLNLFWSLRPLLITLVKRPDRALRHHLQALKEKTSARMQRSSRPFIVGLDSPLNNLSF